MNQIPHWIRTSGIPNVARPTRLMFAVDPAAGNIYYWDTDGAWLLLGGGGGGVSGAPRAIVFIDPSGTGANTDAGLVVRPASLGNYGRPEIWDHRPPTPPGAGPVFRQGASSGDGDSFDSPGDGIVIYGPADNGIQDDTNFTFGRVKSNRFAIRFRQGADIVGDAWHTDTTEQYFKDDAGTRTLTITRATGDAYFGGYVTIQPTKSLDTNVAGILNLGTATATGIAMGYAAPNPLNDPMIFVNQGGVQLHGSNAGIQYASARANRAQFRGNQYGANTGCPGITGFKSRGATIGSLASVAVGDAIFRATAIGVCPDNSTPLSGMITIYVEQVQPTYIATSWEVELNPPEGPTNGRRPMLALTSNGIPCLREQNLVGPPVEVNRAAGVATLGPLGTVTIPNAAVDAKSRFVLTVQDGGAAPTGMIWQSARTVGVDFTISSAAGPADAGVQVYWQIWGQTAASRPF